jgi:N-acetylmuramoyl-L-alanine amidase
VLVEVACLSNDREARLLARPSYRQRIAEALFDGIARYAATVNAPGEEYEKGTGSG